MPLKNSPSKEAQHYNFLAERAAGKPIDQAYAISKNVQREARRKKSPKKR